tara:strand:- start:19401 stop:21365 length:1965 start_codon:yes stop_codon:yes gene_type:complete
MEKVVVDVEFDTNAKKTTSELDGLKKELEEIKGELSEIKDAEKSTGSALGKLSKGFSGMGLAMKGLGIGLIVGAFNLLKDIMMQNQAVMDGVAVATETIGVIFNQLVSVITDIFSAVSKSTEGFEGLKQVGLGLLSLVIEPLKLSFYAIKLGIQSAMLAWEDSFLGGGDEGKIKQLTADINETKDALAETRDNIVDAGKQIADNLGEALTEVGSVVSIATDVATEGVKKISIAGAMATGKALADAKKNEELLEVVRQKQQMQSQLDAELQRQIRDDISKTFEERIAANEELGRILDEQLAAEKAIADEKLRIAKLELDTNSDSVELQTAYQQALLEQLDLEERITGQRSEQLTNQNALIDEQKAAIKELNLASLNEREKEMASLEQDYEAKLELARKAGVDTLEIEAQHREEKKALEEEWKLEDDELQAEQDAIAKEKQDQIDAEEEARRQTKIQLARETYAMLTSMILQQGQQDMDELKAQQDFELKTFKGTDEQLKKLEKKQAKERHKQAIKNWKAEMAVGIANTTMSTAEGVVKAITASAGLGPFGVALGYLNAAMVLATGLKNIQTIKNSKPSMTPPTPSDDGGGGAGGGAGAGGGTEAIADVSNLPSVTEQFNAQFGGQNQEPVQAYVVEQDVTQSQQINTMIEQKSTL